MCSIPDISISQSKDSSTSGIPQYIVQIVNTCVARCAPSNIHLHCGWFASAKMVNPRTFKRLFYDDCLVNEGRPLKNSQIIRFTYSNSFMYPLEFKSARFCWMPSRPGLASYDISSLVYIAIPIVFSWPSCIKANSISETVLWDKPCRGDQEMEQSITFFKLTSCYRPADR